ncbi:Phospholipase A2 crotoxin acid subunit CA [Desmophyllum pertusum]|uniref:Carbonic anhydrase n=1 Tax=Desmophyllum pertusum TaxID=174260 RepID=A0A9W9Z2N4_9CNID|nr:Phospholipase A2 crotoxin acid subunit CA [Desmophyllum pertusum]
MFQAVIFSVLVAAALASKGYGPKDWEKVSAHCRESAQSPINIVTSTVKEDSNLKGLRFTCDNKNGTVSGILINNGHATTLAIDKAKGTASLTGGPLGDNEYKLQKFHFHFGCKGSKGGSEHTVNGGAYSGELHLVTYNTKYPILLLLLINQMGYTGVMVRTFLYNLVPQLKDLSRTSFYSYKGSLTTPPCYQSVNWIVLKRPIPASESVLNDMRDLHDYEEHSMCNNFRPTQPLNHRTVSEYSG